MTESQEVPASRRVALRALSASPGRPAVRREEDARTSTTTESPAPDVARIPDGRHRLLKLAAPGSTNAERAVSWPSTTTPTGRTGHSDSSRPPAPLPHAPAPPSGLYDETPSAVSRTSICKSHNVSVFSAPAGARDRRTIVRAAAARGLTQPPPPGSAESSISASSQRAEASSGGGDQHANPLQLQLRLLSTGIVGRHGGTQAVAAQQTDDQFRLDAAADDRHRYRRALHDEKLLCFGCSPPVGQRVGAAASSGGCGVPSSQPELVACGDQHPTAAPGPDLARVARLLLYLIFSIGSLAASCCPAAHHRQGHRAAIVPATPGRQDQPEAPPRLGRPPCYAAPDQRLPALLRGPAWSPRPRSCGGIAAGDEVDLPAPGRPTLDDTITALITRMASENQPGAPAPALRRTTRAGRASAHPPSGGSSATADSTSTAAVDRLVPIAGRFLRRPGLDHAGSGLLPRRLRDHLKRIYVLFRPGGRCR